MNKDYNSEFAVGVAGAVYAIDSLEEDKAQHRIDIERPRQDTTSRMRDSDRVTRQYSCTEIRTAGETSSTRSMEQDYRRRESTLPTNKPGRSSSDRPVTMEARDQRQNGNYSQLNVAETKADAWEKAFLCSRTSEIYCDTNMQTFRCENMKASILARENERKQAKIARIDQIAGGERAQVDEKRRNEELKIKEKARQIRASGKVPVTCFCF